MESHRDGNRLIARAGKRRQAGITLIGFLLLAAVFGTVGLAVLKIVPLYMEKMRVGAVLEDLQEELGTGGNSIPGILNALNSRFYVENLKELTADEIEIVRDGEGFSVTVNRESRASFLADLYFVVVINEQVEISR
jgi:hypothetical protein